MSYGTDRDWRRLGTQFGDGLRWYCQMFAWCRYLDGYEK